MMKPTEESYNELQSAYDYYNAVLFCGELPSCLITLQRKQYRTRGYFSPGRFGSGDGRRTDELAMNPSHFHTRDTAKSLSTLVHEMVHVWQQHGGKPGRGRYHNREWGQKMKSVGLHPSNTGDPGGRETGDQMTHFIVEGGPFELATASLLSSGFKLTWAEKLPVSLPPPGINAPTPLRRDRSNRVRYQCSSCRSKVWGKPGLSLICGSCGNPFSPVL